MSRSVLVLPTLLVITACAAACVTACVTAGAPPEGDASVPRDLKMPGGADAADLATATPDLATSTPDLTAAPPDLSTGGLDLAKQCTPQTTPCDLICQNCGAGGKCTLDNTGKPVCAQTGTIDNGQPCGKFGGDDCKPGDVCITESPTQMLNTCHRYCRADADCQPGGRCIYTLSVGGVMTNYKICTESITNCNPISKTGCTQPLGCYPVTPDGALGCHLTGPGGQLANCDSSYDCQAGFVCLKVGTAPLRCYKMCPTGNSTSCPSGTTCKININGWTSGYAACAA